MLFFLVVAIVCKDSSACKDYVYRMVYDSYFDFSGVRMFYNKYLGGVFPIEKINGINTTGVFNEDLYYNDVKDYGDGAVLEVGYNYVIPNINEGIVVYIGEKKEYGNVVIVNGKDGEDIWYGNLCNVMVKLYDNINKGSYIGEVCDNKMYMVVTKKNNYLDYRDYLS